MAIDATRQLIDVYRASGRFAAVVEPKIIERDNNRVDLVFEVNEGPLIKIDSISFSGNASFSDRKLKASNCKPREAVVGIFVCKRQI